MVQRANFHACLFPPLLERKSLVKEMAEKEKRANINNNNKKNANKHNKNLKNFTMWKS